MDNRFKIILFSFLGLGLSTVFSIVLIEGALRIFSERLPEEVRLGIHWRTMVREEKKPADHPYIGYLNPPYSHNSFEGEDMKFSFSTDKYGFRNREPWPEHADIVIVGDSMVFGYGVNDEQSWTEISNRMFPEISILNLGLNGAGPQQYKRIYETFGISRRPKLLIVGLFPDNDFSDAQKFDQWLKSGHKGNYYFYRLFGKSEPNTGKGIKEIIKKTYLYAFLREMYNSIRDHRIFQGKTIVLADGNKIQIIPGMLQKQIDSMHPGNAGFDLTIKSLLELKDVATDNSTRLLVFLFPSKEAVYRSASDDFPDDILHPLKEELTKSNIDYLDLTPFIVEHAKNGEKLYFEVDGHLNQKGYKIVSDVLLGQINTYGLLN